MTRKKITTAKPVRAKPVRRLTLPPPEACFRRISFVELFTGLRRTAHESGGDLTTFVWDGDAYLTEKS